MKKLIYLFNFLLLPLIFTLGKGDSINQDWYSSALEKIKKQEYYITYSDDLKTFQSPNRNNNLRFIYNNNGFIVEPRVTETYKFDENDPFAEKEKIKISDDWIAEFIVKGFGRNNIIEKVFSGNDFVVDENIAYIKDQNMKVDYINNKEGMRQNFTIYNKPENENGLLTLSIEIKTNENLLVGADALVIQAKDATEYMKYNSLKIWDADGKELRGWFESVKNNVNDETKKIQIVVNDENAKYPIVIDPLSTTEDWHVENIGNFGYSVATAGDVNGDGYSDVVIGANSYNNGEIGEGAAFLYYGSETGPSLNADWSFESNSPNDAFGYSVSTAGDINGDGFSDLLIGSRGANSWQEGRAYLFLGSAVGISNSPDWVYDGSEQLEYLGSSVSTAGDINGDGFSDIIIGAEGYDGVTANLVGKIYVFHGSVTGLPSIPNWTKEGTNSGGDLGQVVCTAGDVNGDGFSDVIFSENGVVYAHYGSSTGLSSTEDWAVYGLQTGSLFGSSISTAGDINGDGYSDVIVGAWRYELGADEYGAVYLYYGSGSGLSVSPNKIIYGEQIEAKFGESVSTAGDVNGDGYADVIIGASLFDSSVNGVGKIYLYYGNENGISELTDWSLEGDPSTQLALGKSAAIAGDVNGDGFSDFIVGESLGANIYFGAPSILSNSSTWAIEGNQNNATLGTSIATAGDVNGDGFSDIIIGAENYDNGESGEGKVFGYYGSSTGLSLTYNWTVESDQAGSHLGNSLSSAGDVNGDGYDDVIIGAFHYSDGQSNEGAAFIYHGSASGLSLTEDWSTTSDQINAYLGSSVSTAGDINGDGFSDIIVGSPYFDNGEVNEGAVFVYYGSAGGLSSNYIWMSESNQGGAYFGSSVSIVGDVNGDGFSDVIIGSENYDNGQIDEGMAFVYYGSLNGLSSTPDWSFESDIENAYLGNRVSTAGDVNGDGYSDIIIGAYFLNNGQAGEGKVFVFHGSSTGPSNNPDWTKESNQFNAYLGSSISTAGDVNGDGYSDIIIGADNFTNDQVYEGKVSLFLGSSSGLQTNNSWSLEGEQSNANFGDCVAAAGDINGDGYSDIIISASQFENGQSDEGKVFLYYGNNSNGLDSRTKQNNPSSGNILAAGNLTESNGEIEIGHKTKSPFGRADGRIAYEFRKNGEYFTSGDSISNSVTFDGTTTFEDLLINPNGKGIFATVSGLNSNYSDAYQWRVRNEYSLVNNPFQKYGPWKYFSAFNPIQPYAFRPRIYIPLYIIAQIKTFLEGPYNEVNDNMLTSNFSNIPTTSPYEDGESVSSIPVNSVDWIYVELRDKNDNTKIVAGKSGFLNKDGSITNVNGTGPLNFQLPEDDYYIVVKHRNHLPIMSKDPVHLTAN